MVVFIGHIVVFIGHMVVVIGHMVVLVSDMFTNDYIEIVPMKSTELLTQMRLMTAGLAFNADEVPIYAMGLMQFGILMAI